MLSLYIVLWAVIICFWAVEVSLWASALAGVAEGVIFEFNVNVYSGIVMIAAALVCAGLSIFMFYGCKATTNGVIKLTKRIGIGFKNLFIRKERA